mmetsp:Transcript_31282/g.78386  ORF Transcript_31282/g.78386 Transcript_31282/m.78386 type:complete len:203 (-) Transcript_31282:298-906(-)
MIERKESIPSQRPSCSSCRSGASGALSGPPRYCTTLWHRHQLSLELVPGELSGQLRHHSAPQWHCRLRQEHSKFALPLRSDAPVATCLYLPLQGMPRLRSSNLVQYVHEVVQLRCPWRNGFFLLPSVPPFLGKCQIAISVPCGQVTPALPCSWAIQALPVSLLSAQDCPHLWLPAAPDPARIALPGADVLNVSVERQREEVL